MSRRDYAITRREDTINYKVKDVEEADEEKVFDIGDDLEVDLSGLTDMEGIRQRIIMHIEKVKGNYKDQVWSSAATTTVGVLVYMYVMIRKCVLFCRSNVLWKVFEFAVSCSWSFWGYMKLYANVSFSVG